jgi:5'-deoxynucleotidase YfbR-like HD superfamily hydrolase
MEERVGHHTANVVAIIFYLFDDHPPLYLVRAALHHDIPELVTGDLPATAKWRHPELAKAAERVEQEVIKEMGLDATEMDPFHRDILKYADMMDLCFKSVEELALGNDAFFQVLFNGLVYVRGLLAGSLANHAASQQLYRILEANRFINIGDIYDGAPLDNSTKH